MKTVKIDDFIVGGETTYLIADVGSNHKQDIILAKETIDAAYEAGANAVKFQSINLDKLYFNPDFNTKSFIKSLEFPELWHSELKSYCDKKGITFFSSPTYMDAVDLLEKVNVSLYKLASAQVGTFPQIVNKVAGLNKPIIFSTGIANYKEIVETVEIFEKHKNDNYIILHCNSIYPTPPEKVNLNLIKTYQHMFQNPVGFSDHTIGIHIATAAVCLGAKVIEKHFTLDRSIDAPDSNDFASDPLEFSKLVSEVRDIEKSFNSFSTRMDINSEELEFKKSITYKLIANKTMILGHVLSKGDFGYLRTTNGIDCKKESEMIGKKVSVFINAGEVITLESLT